MSVYDDIRFLASKDIRHGRLKWIPDIWFRQYPIFIEYDTDETPLVGIGLRNPSPLPDLPQFSKWDSSNATEIYFGGANLDYHYSILRPAFIKCTLKMMDWMKTKNSKVGWVRAPLYMPHMVAFLDELTTVRINDRVDGNSLLEPDWKGGPDKKGEYGNHLFYVADRDSLESHLKKIL